MSVYKMPGLGVHHPLQSVVHSSQTCHRSRLLLSTLALFNGFRCQDRSHVHAHDSHGHGRPGGQSQGVLYEQLLQAYHGERRCDRGGSHRGRPRRRCSPNAHVCSARHPRARGCKHMRLPIDGDRGGSHYTGFGPRSGCDRVHIAIVVGLDPWKDQS